MVKAWLTLFAVLGVFGFGGYLYGLPTGMLIGCIVFCLIPWHPQATI